MCHYYVIFLIEAELVQLKKDAVPLALSTENSGNLSSSSFFVNSQLLEALGAAERENSGRTLPKLVSRAPGSQ